MISPGGAGGGEGAVIPCKSDRGARPNISRTPLNLVFWACPKFISTPRGTNSTTTNYITSTANFNNK